MVQVGRLEPKCVETIGQAQKEKAEGTSGQVRGVGG